MVKPGNLVNFVEQQEVLNNIKTSIKKIYAGEELIKNEDYLNELTERTLEVINDMDSIYDDLITQPGVLKIAEQFGTTKEAIAEDIIEVMTYSSIAKQGMLIEELKKYEE